jgi:hypothetical protein
MKDENREDLENITKMSAYERLRRLRKCAIMMKELGFDNSMVAEVLIMTKGYE